MTAWCYASMQELSESVQEEHLDQSVFSCLSQFMLLPSLGSEIENLKILAETPWDIHFKREILRVLCSNPKQSR